MKVAADTNVLLRLVTDDAPAQAAHALNLVQNAELVAVGAACLCEICWVLRSRYQCDDDAIVIAIECLVDWPSITAPAGMVEVGLKMLKSGGDFPDGVIAFEGLALGGEAFLTFDKKAVARLRSLGLPACLLGEGGGGGGGGAVKRLQ